MQIIAETDTNTVLYNGAIRIPIACFDDFFADDIGELATKGKCRAQYSGASTRKQKPRANRCSESLEPGSPIIALGRPSAERIAAARTALANHIASQVIRKLQKAEADDGE